MVITLLLVIYIYRNSNSTEGFEDYFKSENEYKNQVKLLTDKYESMSDRRRPVTDILNTNVIVEKMEELLNNEFQDLRGMVVLNVQKRKLQMK